MNSALAWWELVLRQMSKPAATEASVLNDLADLSAVSRPWDAACEMFNPHKITKGGRSCLTCSFGGQAGATMAAA